MKLADFKASLSSPNPPAGLPLLLEALWWDAKGDWTRAHEIAQDAALPGGSWIHAYLHRKEGDEANAGYWYRQARKPHSRLSLDAEWEEIAAIMLNHHSVSEN